MNREEIVIGREYVARVNGVDCVVKVLNSAPSGGWICLNQFTNRQIVVHLARNFKHEVRAKAEASEGSDPIIRLVAAGIESATAPFMGPSGREPKQPPEIVARTAQALDGGTETARPLTPAPDAVALPLRSIEGQGSVLARKLKESAEKDTTYLDAPHLMIEARAGTGKTSTLVWGLQCIKGVRPDVTPSPQQSDIWEAMCQGPKPRTVCFAAFNKSIAEELKQRVPKGMEATTMHSLGYKAVRAQWQGVNVNQYRLDALFEELVGTAEFQDCRNTRPVVVTAVKALVRAAKTALIPLDDEDEADRDGIYRVLQDLVDHYEIDVEGVNGRSYLPEIFELVPRLLNRCRDVAQDMTIDYDDMVWLPAMMGLPMFKYDLLLVDEAQDLNRPQQLLAKMAGRRLVFCGDPKQSIYGFAGADCESMPRLLEELRASKQGCTHLPLTVTRRCGKAVVKEANKVVPDFEAHEGNPEGLVRGLRFNGQDEWLALASSYSEGVHSIGTEVSVRNWRDVVREGDFVLCRTNGPLVSECFRFIRQGRRAKVRGRDLGAGLIALIKNLDENSLGDLVTKADRWAEAEAAKERAKKFPSESKITGIYDKAMCIRVMCENTPVAHLISNEPTVLGVIDRIEMLFTDDPNSPGIVLSSIHKAKGLEARRVFFIQPKGGRCPHPSARTDWEQEQEWNLWYVACTRATEELYHVIED